MGQDEENKSINYWDDLDLSVEEFNSIANDNQNFISTIVGYVSEKRLRERFLDNHPDVEEVWSPEDQDTSEKGDLAFTYKGEEIRVEVKSLQTRHIQKVESDTTQQNLQGDTAEEQIQWKGKTHIKGSNDPREIQHGDFEDTTVALNLKKPGFDILAVCLFFFDYEWDFAFVCPEELKRSKKRGWPEEVREKYAVSKPKVTKPPMGDWTDDLFDLMDEILEEREDN